MKNFKYIFTVLIMFLSLNSAGFAQVFNFEKNPNLSNAIFPAGTFFKGKLQNELSSAKSVIGDKVYLILPFDVKLGEITCIPKKTLISGQIINIHKAQFGKNGYIQVKFNSMKFPDGWETGLSAYIWSGTGTGIIGGDTTKRKIYKKIPHYIEDLGIVAQLVESGDRVMGQEKYLPAGTECIIVLDNDMKVRYLNKLQ